MIKRKVTQEEEDYVVANDSSMTISALAKSMGRSVGTLNKVRKRLGLKKDDKQPWSEEEKQFIANNPAMTNKELALKLSRTISMCGSYRAYNGLRMDRKCVFCDSIFVAQQSCAKVCSDCNPSMESNRLSPLVRLGVYRDGAVKRGLPFDLTDKEFISFWQKPCTYCGDDIETIGLDRINSELGYNVTNVTPCCKRCNEMKMADTKTDWINKMKKILTNLGEV